MIMKSRLATSSYGHRKYTNGLISQHTTSGSDTKEKIISDTFYGLNDYLCVICTWCVLQIEFDDSQYKTFSSLSKRVECISLQIGVKNV